MFWDKGHDVKEGERKRSRTVGVIHASSPEAMREPQLGKEVVPNHYDTAARLRWELPLERMLAAIDVKLPKERIGT